MVHAVPVVDDGVDPRRAKCRTGEALTDLFFSNQLDEIATARALCQTCSELNPCLQGARHRREPWGVWGGELFLDGQIVGRKRPRGRPRKDDRVARSA